VLNSKPLPDEKEKKGKHAPIEDKKSNEAPAIEQSPEAQEKELEPAHDALPKFEKVPFTDEVTAKASNEA
jgi:hypothetical protein